MRRVVGFRWQRITVRNNDGFEYDVGHSCGCPSVVFYADLEPNVAAGIELFDARRWMGNLHIGALDLSVMYELIVRVYEKCSCECSSSKPRKRCDGVRIDAGDRCDVSGKRCVRC